MEAKIINKTATIEQIVQWTKTCPGHEINKEALEKLVQEPEWETMLRGIAKFCNVEIVYE